MPKLKLVIDEETFAALEQRATSERRSTDCQAEVLIRQSLGLPFPIPAKNDEDRAKEEVDKLAQERQGQNCIKVA